MSPTETCRVPSVPRSAARLTRPVLLCWTYSVRQVHTRLFSRSRMNLISSSVFLSPPCLSFQRLPAVSFCPSPGLTADVRPDECDLQKQSSYLCHHLHHPEITLTLLPVRFCGNTLQPDFISHQPTLPSCLCLW